MLKRTNMNQIRLIIHRFILLLVVSLLATSCLGALLGSNDNAKLYGTEWSIENETQGLKFFSDDSVLYFYPYGRCSGTFDYNASTEYIELQSLSVTYNGKTTYFTSCEIKEDGTMELNWHNLGESKNYYMVLYKRR